MPYDIGRLATRKFVEDGKDFQLIYPGTTDPICDDDGKPVTFNLSGAECSRLKAVVRERQRARTEAIASAKAQDKPAPEFDQIEDQIADLASLTNGWSSMVWDGKPFPFSKENAERIYRESPFIMEWAIERVVPRINFLPTASKP
jgi:hypothetical protein